MSVRHEQCGVYFLNKNFEWEHHYFDNDLAQDAAISDGRQNNKFLYVAEDYGQHESWFEVVEQAARQGKNVYEIDQALDDYDV